LTSVRFDQEQLRKEVQENRAVDQTWGEGHFDSVCDLVRGTQSQVAAVDEKADAICEHVEAVQAEVKGLRATMDRVLGIVERLVVGVKE